MGGVIAHVTFLACPDDETVPINLASEAHLMLSKSRPKNVFTYFSPCPSLLEAGECESTFTRCQCKVPENIAGSWGEEGTEASPRMREALLRVVPFLWPGGRLILGPASTAS